MPHKLTRTLEVSGTAIRSHRAVSVLSVLALGLMVLSLTSSSYSSATLLRSLAFIGIAALGEHVVLQSGGIDLSISAVYTLAGLLCTVMVNLLRVPTPAAILLGLMCSALLGLVNGILITRFALPSYIATIATLGIYNGIFKILSSKYPILYLPADFTILGQGQWLGIPLPFLICVTLFLAYHLFLSKTILGRWIGAVGNNAWAAEQSGIRVGRVKRIAYVICGFFAGLSGILEAARVGFSWQSTEPTLMLGIIAAAMTSMYEIHSSRWKVLGVVLGTVLIVGMKQCLALFQLMAWEDFLMGGSILFVCVLDKHRR